MNNNKNSKTDENLVNDHDPCDHSDRRHRCVILYIYIVRAVCCASHRRLPYIIYTVHCTLLHIYMSFWGKLRISWDQYSVRRQHMVHFPAEQKKGNGFSIYILPLLAHILWSREITVNVCIYLLPTSEHRFIKYINTQARLLCKYVIGVIQIFKTFGLTHFDVLSLSLIPPCAHTTISLQIIFTRYI